MTCLLSLKTSRALVVTIGPQARSIALRFRLEWCPEALVLAGYTKGNTLALADDARAIATLIERPAILPVESAPSAIVRQLMRSADLAVFRASGNDVIAVYRGWSSAFTLTLPAWPPRMPKIKAC